MQLVALEGVATSFGGTETLHDIDPEIGTGEAVVVSAWETTPFPALLADLDPQPLRLRRRIL